MIRDRVYQLGIETYKRVSRYHTFNVRQVKVETTKACNLKCPGCRRNYTQGTLVTEPGPVHLTPGALWRILATTNMMVVRFEGDGEPTCNPHLRELVKMCGDLGIRSAMTCNGTLLDEKYIKFLEENGMSRIHISFDGATKSTFEKLRTGADFDKVLYNCSLIGKSNIQLFMNVLLSTSEVVEELPGYPSLAKKVNATGVHLMKFQAETLEGFQGPNLSLHGEPIKEFVRKAKALGLLYTGTVTETLIHGRCDDPYTCPYVLLNDDVYPCSYTANLRRSEVFQGEVFKVPYQSYKMGNLKERWMRNIWFSKEWQELRGWLRFLEKSRIEPTLESLKTIKRRSSTSSERFAYCMGCPCIWGESGL